MNKESKNKKLKKGFTLIEMLVVVLIIGILVAIALPQYQMAVTKAKVAAILPMMRHIKDSLMEWKLTNGTYCKDDTCIGSLNRAFISDLGIECPDGWNCNAYGEMENDYWYCFPNEEGTGMVSCSHDFGDGYLYINMFQPDDEEIYPNRKGMTTCVGTEDIGKKICNSIGVRLIEDHGSWVEYSF